MLKPEPNWRLKKFLEGMSFVFTWIKPPAHSPGSSGTKALLITILSIMLAGIKSKENAFLSGSVLPRGTPFNNAKLYRSASPLIIKNFPSCILAPGVRLSTSPVFLSGERLIDSPEITEATVFVFFWKAISALTVSPFAVAVLAVALTDTSDNTLPPSFKIIFTVSSSPAFATVTSSIVFSW